MSAAEVQRKPADDSHPDQWGPGLRFGAKALNSKRVSRAKSPGDVLPICLAHNLRRGNDDHRHRGWIDPRLTVLNEVLLGSDCPEVGAERVQGIFDAHEIRPTRSDAIMGVELVFQPPAAADTPAFWDECIAWASTRYRHIVSAVVHRDQSRPHMHLLALAIISGRLAGDVMTAGVNRFTLQRQSFLKHMRAALHLRPDRRVKTLAELAISTGKGARTQAAAARSDAELIRRAESSWQDAGMGVGGHGVPTLEWPTPMPKTPLLRVSPHIEALFEMCRSMADFPSHRTRPIDALPMPSNRHHQHLELTTA